MDADVKVGMNQSVKLFGLGSLQAVVISFTSPESRSARRAATMVVPRSMAIPQVAAVGFLAVRRIGPRGSSSSVAVGEGDMLSSIRRRPSPIVRFPESCVRRFLWQSRGR